MKFRINHLIAALLISSLPSLAGAAENAQPTTAAPAPAPAPAPASAQPTTKPLSGLSLLETPKAAQPQQVRIGYVDIPRVGTESKAGQASLAKAKERQTKLQNQIETKRKQLDKQKAALEAKAAAMSPGQREAKAKEFRKRVEEFQKFGMNADKELQALQEEINRKLFESIEQAATEVGKNKGLALVMIKRDLLYLADGVDAQDITEDIIKLLNADKK